MSITAVEFKKKWAKFIGKESAGYQAHFEDLCRMLGMQTPTEADPSGSDFFCYQKRVVKDMELFELNDAPSDADPAERGFADVWKKGCFAWEYKGKKKNLDAAYKQLLQYRESLLNPPLLVVCDFDRFIVRTNFNGTVQETHEFTNDQIDRPENLRILRSLFDSPDFLKPQRTTAQVTEKLAEQIAEVARLLQSRESIELSDAKSRAEVTVAQKKNLRIARFLNRIVFCLFAEDTGLLPAHLFSELIKAHKDDPHFLAQRFEELFRAMAKGGSFGQHKIRQFNGHLFEEATVFELTSEELGRLAEVAEADWQYIEPSIMGTLFMRALDESQRAQLGAHYTCEADIKTLVEPVLMQPLRAEWTQIKGQLAAAYAKGKATPSEKDLLIKFQKKLAKITVLDPACGSGNFLYVSLQLLLGLEKEVLTYAAQLGLELKPLVSVQQLKAIEINPYAYELAQVSVQIGYLQWRRDNGFDNDRTPVLQNLDGFENKDALLHETFRKKPKNLKEARKEEHHYGQDELFKVYVERAWPECDVIVGNPPFLGDKLMRGELGDGYVEELRSIYGNRIPGQSDLCCYWFEKARDLIEQGKCKRAGLLATQGIRGGANREVLKRIKQTGDIFFAVSDREWVLDGANVHVSMVGFDLGSCQQKTLNGSFVAVIHANLTEQVGLPAAKPLSENANVCFLGVMKAGAFDVDEGNALRMLFSPNPNGRPNSEVLRPRFTARDILQRTGGGWIIDFGCDSEIEIAARFQEPFSYIETKVKPERLNNRRKSLAKWWWIHGEPRPALRKALAGLRRFIITPEVSKHRIFVWMDTANLADHQTRVFAVDDDCSWGVLQSRFHEVWALAQGTQLREKESGFRYTPTTCFETFPFPRSTFNAKTVIAAAALELNNLRQSWLYPPEWVTERNLEFPGSVTGPWVRYVVNPDANGIGTVRYPRLEPRDADCAAKLKKRTLTNLYNERPAWLDLAHRKLDETVAAAYGWPADLKDEEILERLLALNLERAAAEAKADKAQPTKRSRGKTEDEMV